MVRVKAERLREIGEAIFTALGLSEEAASFLVETLVEASLTGHDSHGIQYYTRYAERIREGYIKVDAQPRVVKETPTTALVDGAWAPGQITARKVTRLAVEKAKQHMVSAVGAYNCNHIGRIGYYTQMASGQGVIAELFVNVGHPIVSAHNGFGPLFGTNPFSLSVPTEGAPPFLVDYATSMVAAGKLSFAASKGARIPTHWARDAEGQETDDPEVLGKGGWLLPFGSYKGYGLQLCCELLGAVLTGSRTGIDPRQEPPSSNGVLMVALNPEAFVGLQPFKEAAGALLDHVKSSPSLPGREVLVPGMPEARVKEERLRLGVEVPETTWRAITGLCGELGVDATLK
ncbi:MAG TPA: Ldh family oxidoreductase, partial [Candidatus Bathyarchaeota archaeon]|nr:Ldh family oxidoreductase [Candidatus Bathyarchaeota archaeon]